MDGGPLIAYVPNSLGKLKSSLAMSIVLLARLFLWFSNEMSNTGKKRTVIAAIVKWF